MTSTAERLSGTALAPTGLLMVPGACHTTTGFGEDLSNTGDAIERSAEENARK